MSNPFDEAARLQVNPAGCVLPGYLRAADIQPLTPIGRKYDDGKAPLVQGCIAYFGKALRAVALVSKYGASKYNAAFADQNWRKVDNAKGRYADALARHLEAHSRGELIDEESGCPHIDMVAWNALALSELEKA